MQQRHDLVDEVVEAGGRDVRDEDEPVGRVVLHASVDLLGDLPGGADERVPGRRLGDELADAEVLGLGHGPPLLGRGDRIVELAGAALDDRRRGHVGVDVGQRTVGIVCGQISVPELFEEQDRRTRAHLLLLDHLRALLCLGRGVAEHDRRGGDDLEIAAVAAVGTEAALDVFVERSTCVVARVAGEDDVGGAGRELPAAVAVAGLDDDRMDLWAAGHVVMAADVELAAVVAERTGVGRREELSGCGVGDEVIRPRTSTARGPR